MPPLSIAHFELEDRRWHSLILASASDVVGKKHSGVTLPLQLKAAVGKLPRQLCKRNRPQSNQQAVKFGKELRKRGMEIQRTMSVFAGVLINSVARVAQQLAGTRIGPRQSPQFHESFRLPWQLDRREGTRRACREAQSLARALAARGEEYERNLDVRAAVQCFEEVNRLAPGDIHYLTLLAKHWSDLTFYYDVTTDRERRLVNLKALEYADKAVVEHPQSALGHVAQCVSKGRLALFVDNRTKVRLAKEAQEAARLAIQVDPYYDVAHHLMGRWHYEMAQINPILRTLVRLMYGTALSPGTHAEALASFRRASELNPRRLIHRVEEGKVLMQLGRKEDALQAFEEALELEVDDINAWHTRMDAERLLAQMHKRPYTQPSLVPPHARQHEQQQQQQGEVAALLAPAKGGTSQPASPASLTTAALIEKSEGGMPRSSGLL